MWIFYRILYFIRDIPKNIKWFIQRGIRGYADKDVWSMDYWFERTIIPMLKQLKEIKHGYPMDMEEAEWDAELSKMIKCFTEMSEYSCSMKNEYDKEFHEIIWEDMAKKEINKPDNHAKEIRENWFQREKEISNYRVKMKDEAFRLFSKYFWNLWD